VTFRSRDDAWTNGFRRYRSLRGTRISRRCGRRRGRRGRGPPSRPAYPPGTVRGRYAADRGRGRRTPSARSRSSPAPRGCAAEPVRDGEHPLGDAQEAAPDRLVRDQGLRGVRGDGDGWRCGRRERGIVRRLRRPPGQLGELGFRGGFHVPVCSGPLCGSTEESCAPGGASSAGVAARAVAFPLFPEGPCCASNGPCRRRTSFVPTARRVPSRPFASWIFATETWWARAIFPSVSPFRTTCVGTGKGDGGIAASRAIPTTDISSRFISGTILH